MVAYAMRITDLDPLRHGLLFERFLNPERVSMPDFDIDFDERRRGEVISYVTEKYGDDRVSMIVTYGTIKAKQAVKDSSRILGYPFAMGDRITKAMPAAVMGKDIPLKEIFDPEHKRYGEGGEFRGLYEADPDVKRVVDTAMGIEGLKRQWGVHAAGVIMSSEPLHDVIPLLKRPGGRRDDHAVRLPDLRDARPDQDGLPGAAQPHGARRRAANIEANRGETLVLEDARRSTTSASYELLGTGDTLGVFQLDGGPMRALLRLMRPDSFEDISAVLALYRPGPMGVDSPHQLRPAQERQAGDQPDPPRARGAARGDPRADLRPDRLPGAGHGGGPEGGGLHARPGRPAAQGDGQEEEGDPRRRVRPVLRGHERQRLLRGRDQGAVGHPGPVLRLRLQQGPHRGVRPDLLLDRLPQAALRARVHGRPAHLGQGRQGQVRRSTSTSAAG